MTRRDSGKLKPRMKTMLAARNLHEETDRRFASDLWMMKVGSPHCR